MVKRWNALQADEVQLKGFIKETKGKIPVPLLKILIQRGIDSVEKARAYFSPSLLSLHNPLLMKGMQTAVQRIITAINNNEKILVYGDYDVDGTTAVAVMVKFLHKIYNASYIDFYIPHRYKEGYGISKAGVDFAIAGNFSLVIALDCGIKSVQLISYAKEHNIDFIVCDHHLPDEILPPATAILNPKQPGCNYPYKELCGCGVGFKLVTALGRLLNLPEGFENEYLDLVATAIAADIVPITGENRILAYHGLIKANNNPNKGILALRNLSQVQGALHINSLVFMIAPRVNAAGRMDDARKAVLMFIAATEADAMEYAKELHTDNTERKETDKAITEEALAMIQSNEVLINRKSTVLYKETWHKGVVGIVASRLTEHYYRPTIILTQSGEFASGSARSVYGYNIYEAIHKCNSLLLNYGGHFYAAGLTLPIENVSLFQDMFEKVVNETIEDELLIPLITVDAEISFSEINQPLVDRLLKMEPFGPENMRPVFLSTGVLDAGSRVVKENHIKFRLSQGNFTCEGIGFNLADKFQVLESGQPIDVVYTLGYNEWNGKTSIQITVVDFRATPVEEGSKGFN